MIEVNLILIFIVDSNIIIKKMIIFAQTFKTYNMNLTHYLPINTTEKVDLILSELLKAVSYTHLTLPTTERV